MAGEMSQSEVTRDAYPDLFRLMDALKRRGIRSEPKAFDQYQGPYLAVRNDIRVGNAPYQVLTNMPGVLRVWLHEHGFIIENDRGFESEGASYVMPETPAEQKHGVYTLRQAARRIEQVARRME